MPALVRPLSLVSCHALVPVLAALSAFAIARPMAAQNSITFNSSTTNVIGCGTLTWENYDVTIDGVTVTIDCAHTFHSLTLVNGGGIVHSVGQPMHLTITTDLAVNAGCRISALGRGHSWTVNGGGPGGGASSGNGYGEGGSYGGSGGRGQFREILVPAYGSFTDPADLGSAGGNFPPSVGGSGGGAIRLTVGGILRVDGTLEANGSHGAVNYVGGGSGGSLWITTGTFTGLGVVEANGGNGGPGHTGGGGGGRISITYTTNTFGGALRARGGTWGAGDGAYGGAGTIYSRDRANTFGDLLLDNSGAAAHSATAFRGTITVRHLTVRSDAILSPWAQDASLHLDIRGNATVGTSGYVSASSRGHDWAVNGGGPGGGASSGPGEGEGGSHGGAGGASASRRPVVTSYGQIDQPTDMGSAGGNAPPALGGIGGGAIRLTVAGTLRVDGWISANGGSGAANYVGGGSGGSLWITTGTFTGLGVVEANGGNGGPGHTGGGGGGRISITYTTNTFGGALRARGGTWGAGNGAYGGAGTIYTKNQANAYGDLLLDNLGAAAHSTTDLTGLSILRNLVATNDAMLSHLAGDESLELDVRGDCTISASGWVNLQARGHGPGRGPGAGASSGTTAGGGGAGHGGLGGRAGSGLAGGYTYDAIQHPANVGSGGGNGQLPNYGGAGGGKIKLTVAGTLLVDGTITANGTDGSSTIGSGYGGGGSGGSLWIIAGTLTGAGRLLARGGSAPNNNSVRSGGGGGGGRIAIHSANTGGFIGAMEVNGGTGYANGANGTLYRSSAPQYLHNVVNLTAGATATFEVVGARPQTMQLFTISLTGTGSTPIPQLGVTLGLTQPELLGWTMANTAGIATVTIRLPASTRGTAVWSQAIDYHPTAAARLSNLVGGEIR